MCVTSLLCGPRADLWPFYGFLCKRFSLYVGKLFFFYWNPFIFVGYGNDRFFSHTNPYILNVTQQCRCSPMLTWDQALFSFRFENYLRLRRCLYFELGLPVVQGTESMWMKTILESFNSVFGVKEIKIHHICDWKKRKHGRQQRNEMFLGCNCTNLSQKTKCVCFSTR